MTDTQVRADGRRSTSTRTRRTNTTRPQNRPSDGGPATETPVNGLVDIVDDKAWVRADGYLPGPDDVPIASSQLRSLGLRRGDHVTGIAQTVRPQAGHPAGRHDQR